MTLDDWWDGDWRSLVSRAEDQWFDRKSFRIDARKLAETIIAFANAEGGSIALGIEDRAVMGKPTAKQSNTIRQAAFDFTDPTVKFELREIPAQTPEGEEALIVVIDIPQSERVHLTPSGASFLRNGDSTQKLAPDDVLELRFTKGDQQYDRTPVAGTSLDDIDGEALAAYARAIGSSTPEDALNARGLVTRDGVLTAAAMLLFGQYPQRFFPEARIRVLKWHSTRREAGSAQMLSDDRQFEGRILEQVFEAKAFIEGLLPSVTRLGPDGTFIEQSVIPPDAWLEGLVNAVIHRSYSLSGDHIRFEIFPDRIEVTSPGRFPGLADPSHPRSIARFARNPIIARVASDLRVGQELGEGIRRIFQEMHRAGFEEPRYVQTSGTATLVLTARRQVSDDIRERLPKHSEAVLEVMRRVDHPLGTSEIADYADLSQPTTRKALAALRDEGLVLWEGNSPNDPRAVWKLLPVF